MATLNIPISAEFATKFIEREEVRKFELIIGKTGHERDDCRK